MTIEKSADPLDMASQLTDRNNEQARLARDSNERQRRIGFAKLVADGHDPFTCFDCGEGLPPQRIEDQRLRCTYCQDALERKIRHGRGN